MIRCQPASNDFQQSVEQHLIMSPIFHMQKSADAFGNRIAYGGTRDMHDSLTYISTGIVRCGKYAIRSEDIRPYYKIPTVLTAPSVEMEDILPVPSGSIETQAMEICHRVHETVTYMPFTTDVRTTAAEALRQATGVCQDMAHIMIALCRMQGISARYVNGFLLGTGATHAWVEVACTDAHRTTWIGIDPTHDSLIDYGYIKLSHGRDADDCPVNRGTYLGNVTQQTLISVTVKEV